MKYLLLFLLFFDKVKAQSGLDSSNQNFYQKYQLSTSRPDYRSFPLIELKVIGVDSTQTPFNDGLGRIGYCGDIEGGIKNLLQNVLLFSTSHIKFLNRPSKKQYVLFYALGAYVSNQTVGESPSKCYLDNSVMARGIILNMMATEYNFDVKDKNDSLEVIELRIKDSFKLSLSSTPYNKHFLGGSAKTDTLTKQYNSIRAHLSYLTMDIGRNWNVLTYDETGMEKYRYDFTIPSGLLNSPDKFSELNRYLEENLGLTLVKTKRLEKIYTIEFKNE
jgi:hypothetical protein